MRPPLAFFTPGTFDAANTSLHWAFYTGFHTGAGAAAYRAGKRSPDARLAAKAGLGGWEGFYASIMQLSW